MHPDLELRLILMFTRILPKIRGMGFFANILVKFYNRKPRPLTLVPIFDFQMFLSPRSGILYYPQLHDHKEIKFLKQNLAEGDVFVDVGANVGFYSLVAAGQVKPAGKVISVEADEQNYAQLSRSVAQNNLEKVVFPVNVGASDKDETITFYISGDNREGNSFVFQQGFEQKQMKCLPLLDILKNNNVTGIKILKIDIEGYEYKVLKHFFENAPKSLFPEIIIVEYMPQRDNVDTSSFIQSNGYKLRFNSGFNYILTKN